MKKNNIINFIIIFTIVLFIDQFIKFLIIKNNFNIIIIKNFLSFNYKQNFGVAFSLFENNNLFTIIISFAVIIYLLKSILYF